MALPAQTQPEFEPRKLAEIEDQITELAAHIHAATFQLLELIREFDEREGWGGPGLKSCAHWLNWKCGIGLGAAREKVRVAHALKDLPQISDEFRCGRISFSKVRAMTRVATPETEEYLLMIARHGTASHVEKLVSQFRKVKRIEAMQAEEQRHNLRELDWHVDDDGSYVFRARLTPEQGERVVKAIESAMDEEFEERKNVSAETSDRPAIDPSSDPVAQRRADTLARVAEGFLGGTAGTNGGERTTIHLHADSDTLRRDGEGAESRLDSGSHVSAETSSRSGDETAMPGSKSRPTRRFRSGKAKKWTTAWRSRPCCGSNRGRIPEKNRELIHDRKPGGPISLPRRRPKKALSIRRARQSGWNNEGGKNPETQHSAPPCAPAASLGSHTKSSRCAVVAAAENQDPRH